MPFLEILYTIHTYPTEQSLSHAKRIYGSNLAFFVDRHSNNIFHSLLDISVQFPITTMLTQGDLHCNNLMLIPTIQPRGKKLARLVVSNTQFYFEFNPPKFLQDIYKILFWWQAVRPLILNLYIPQQVFDFRCLQFWISVWLYIRGKFPGPSVLCLASFQTAVLLST